MTTQTTWSAGDSPRLIERRSISHRLLAINPDDGVIFAAINTSSALRVDHSTDMGITWVAGATPDATYTPTNGWVTAAGTLIVNCAGKLYRSTDDADSFAEVLDVGQPNVTLLSNCLTEGPAGTLYVSPYTTTAGAYPSGLATVYTSTDDGMTWSTHSTFPSTIDGGTGDNAIRHPHAIASVAAGLFVATGDNNAEAGIWKWVADAWVRQTPSESNPDAQRWRTVSLQQRGERIYWARDTGGATRGEIGWAPASDLSDYSQVATIETGVFYSAQLADGTLLFGGSAEGGAADDDQIVRIWAVDGDDSVSVVWSELRHELAGVSDYGTIYTLGTDGTTVVHSARNVVSLSPPGEVPVQNFVAFQIP